MVAPYHDGRIARSMVRVPGSGIDEDAGAQCLNLGNVSQFAAMIPVPQRLSFSTHNGRHQVTSSFSLGGSTNQKMTGETTSLPADDAIKAEELSDSSVPLPVVDSSSHITQADTPVSAPTPAPSAGVNRQRSSGFKRPVREESIEESEAPSLPKRSRGVSAAPHNGAGSGSIPSQPTATSWALPLAWGTNGNTVSAMPVLLPVVSSSGTAMAVPLSMVQSTGGPSPTFVLQPVPSQVLQPVPSQATRYQPVLVAGPKYDDQRMIQERDQLKKENEALKYRLSRFCQIMRNKERLIRVLRHLDAVPS